MTSGWDLAGSLLSGLLRDGGAPWPFALTAVLCDLRPRFLPKCVVGDGLRAVARNGRVLLCSDRPLVELIGRTVRIRLQSWNRSILPGDAPQAYGVLLHVRGLDAAAEGPVFSTRLAAPGEGDLTLDVGGEEVLEFRRAAGG